MGEHKVFNLNIGTIQLVWSICSSGQHNLFHSLVGVPLASWMSIFIVSVGEGPPLGDGFIEPSLPREQVRQDAYPLPKDFEWCMMDLNDTKQVRIIFLMQSLRRLMLWTQVKEVYDLLSLNYVEDDDASFRFQYSAEFLHW
jgi:glycylpeptide N-tetradecanoyltransferase